MKIIFLIPEMLFGGSERWVSNISTELTNMGHDVMVVANVSDCDYPLICRFESLETPAVSGKLNRVLNLLKRMKRYKKLIKREKPDIIVSVRKAGNRLNTLCRFKGVKQFISCRGFKDLMYDPRAFTTAEKKLDGIIFNSKQLCEYYREHYNGSPDKTFFNYNLIDFEAIENGKKQPLSDPELEKFLESHRVITCVARLAKLKGQEELIRAFEMVKEKVPDAGLCLVGGKGDNADNVIKAAKNSKFAEDIYLAGDRKNPFNIMCKSYVYAMPSIAEGFPNALVEALTCELPIVAARCMTGPAEILEEGKYGILSGPIEGGEEELAEKLVLSLTDTALYDKLKGLSYKRAMDFSAEKSVADFMEIIGE